MSFYGHAPLHHAAWGVLDVVKYLMYDQVMREEFNVTGASNAMQFKVAKTERHCVTFVPPQHVADFHRHCAICKLIQTGIFLVFFLCYRTRDYNPKTTGPPPSQAAPPQQFLVSPITGEKIPANKIEEHMRYGGCGLATYVDQCWETLFQSPCFNH